MNNQKMIDIAYMLLRVASGFMFMHHGGQKLFGWFGGMPGGKELVLMSQTGIGGILEFFGGLLILLGLATRVTAFLMSGTMAVAYFQFHQPQGLLPIQNKGELAALYCFLFLFMAAYGGGPYSLDAIIRKKR